MLELYKKHRPKKLDDVIGQDSAVKVLQSMAKRRSIPHTMLFTGPSGCGKTTLARILRRILRCGRHDFVEMNCADVRGIDEVRKIRQRMHQAPISGDCRIWLIDEAHKLTNDAQNALLKMLEDTPRHVYFMLCTTAPEKLLRTIRTRATEIAVKSLDYKALEYLVTVVLDRENVEVSEDVLERIISYSDGSARKALVLLDQVIGLEDEEEMLDAIEKSTMKEQATKIASSMLNPRTNWSEMAKLLKNLEGEEPEQIRWMVLGYCKAVMLGGGKFAGRAFDIVQVFRDNFYDSKWAGLVVACYEIVEGK